MARDTEREDASQISADRETIRTWAEEHDATPYRHRDEERFRVVTGDDVGGSHEAAGWDEFFSHLEEGDRVVIYHGQEADEPFEVTHREEVFTRSDVDREELEERLIEGETVTSTVTETTVVEEVIVEEATIESELVDTAIVDDNVVDVELIRRECTECTLEDTGNVSETDWFDVERYVTTVGRPETVRRTGTTEGELSETGTAEGETTDSDTTEQTEAETTMRDVDEFPFSAVLEVEEAWSVTRELTERFTVESRVADVDVAETDTIEDHDIDVEGLQRSIVESDIIELDRSPDEVMTESEIETEFSEDDAIHTHFTRTRVVEDQVVDRQRLRADVTDAELLEFERIETRDVETELSESDEAAVAGESDEVAGDADTGAISLSDDEIGKDVVDAAGETIGMVTDVSEDGTTMYVDAHPGITDRIKAALDWGDADDDDYPVEVEQIDHVTRDEIQLKAAEELEESTPAS